MARPPKDGFDYFPVDVDFDHKVKALQLIYKNDGTAWFLNFLQTAYKNLSGEVDLRPPFDQVFSEGCNITVEKNQEILTLALRVEFCYAVSDGIYTSNGIQKRIAQILKERKEAKERKNKTKGKECPDCSGGKPISKPENPLSGRTTNNNTEQRQENIADDGEPKPGSPDYEKYVSSETEKSIALVRRINELRAKPNAP